MNTTNKPIYSNIDKFEATVARQAPFMLPSFRRQSGLFGQEWATEFDDLIGRFSRDNDTWLDKAVAGYINFAIDGMRLQRRFEKSGQYEPKSYEQAGDQVYHNREYMFGLYLPGILLSHYLWPHHYRALEFFNRTMRPAIEAHNEPKVCDIGPGTGFYSRKFLTASPLAEAWAFDISQSSLDYSRLQAEVFEVSERFRTESRNVITAPTDKTWPFLICVEVLEHLEDPLSFLRALHGMLHPGGRGYITAAVTAANEDHIFLYNSGDEVGAQLESAGFSILDRQYDRAYESKSGEPVPVNAAFFVTRE